MSSISGSVGYILYSMFIEPMITFKGSLRGSLGTYGLTQKSVWVPIFYKAQSTAQGVTGVPSNIRQFRQRLGVNRIDSCNFERCLQLCIINNSTASKDGLDKIQK